MMNDLPLQYLDDELELTAYNAAFCELEFSWYWDAETYCRLKDHSADAAEQIGYYLKLHQPHLLKAYDVEFLANLIQETKATQVRHRDQAAQIAFKSGMASKSLGSEIRV